MVKIYLSTLFIVVFNLGMSVRSEQGSLKYQPISKFNYHMEQLYTALRNGEQKRACDEGYSALKIIKEETNSLKKFEPYYDWVQIRGALKANQKKICSETKLKMFLNYIFSLKKEIFLLK